MYRSRAGTAGRVRNPYAAGTGRPQRQRGRMSGTG
jgi:hypothetical protein